MQRIVAFVACALLVGAGLVAQTNSPPVDASRIADSLPSDKHEGLTVSVDCYKDRTRAREKFGKANPVPVGILPVEIFLRNDTPQPIRIKMDTIQLDLHPQGGHREDIDWLPLQEVARTIAHPNGPPRPKQPRFPIGLPAATDKKVDQLANMLRPLILDADVVPPLGTIHGFLFFDLNHDFSLADHASLYVPDLTNIPSKKALMFFEVALGEN